MTDPFQEEGDRILTALRRLSTPQLRTRFRTAFRHRPRKRDSRETLLTALLSKRCSWAHPSRPRFGPKVIDVVFDELHRHPKASPLFIVERVREHCPWSRIGPREIPWYKMRLRETVEA